MPSKSSDAGLTPSEPAETSPQSSGSWACRVCGKREVTLTAHETFSYRPGSLQANRDGEINRLAGVVCVCGEWLDPSDELWDEIERVYSERD